MPLWKVKMLIIGRDEGLIAKTKKKQKKNMDILLKCEIIWGADS